MPSHLTNRIDKLIGIPFKIGREDFEYCDCVGIAWLYHKHVHGKDYPHRDGYPLAIRDKKKDFFRILSVIRTWATEVSFDQLKEGDIVITKTIGNIGALSVCINQWEILYMNSVHGSSTMKLSKIRNIFIKGFRPNE